MEACCCCVLEVNVNGEETFMVDKNIVATYSGRLSKLFGKSKCTSTAKSRVKVKVVFHNFPGGPECFELILRFCYNSGRTQITPFNISLLHCAAKFMEMKGSLLDLTERSLEEMRYWSWSELLTAIKQSQTLLPASSGLLKRCFESLVGRLTWTSETSPCPSTSPESSGFRFSCDTKSTESSKTGLSRTVNWWFEDLLFLTPVALETLVNSMISRRLDHALIAKFLIYHHRAKLSRAATLPSSSSSEKRRITEAVVGSLCRLDPARVPCKSLFDMTRVAAPSLKTSKTRGVGGAMSKLEALIGSQLDRATLDNLLAPSPRGRCHLYDVDLVLRLVEAFLRGKPSGARLGRVATLLDSYIAETAPDPHLRPSKFSALITALPESARASYDEVYRAIDMYLEVHTGMSEEEKTRLCRGLNHEKLSYETCIHLSKNAKFPSQSAVRALLSQQSRLKRLLKSTNSGELSQRATESREEEEEEEERQVVLYAGELDLSSDNKNLKAHLQGMQWRVMELERVCRKMQAQMARVMRSRAPQTSHSYTRSLPRLCS